MQLPRRDGVAWRAQQAPITVDSISTRQNPVCKQNRKLLDAIVSGDTDEASYLAASHLHLMPEEQGPVIALHPDYFKAVESQNRLPLPPMSSTQKTVPSIAGRNVRG